jgi:abortive infection bacteriophage resistance protein
MQYQKPPLTYIEQLDLLSSRGLHVENKESAIKYLRQISYYRLSAYFLPFKQSDKFHIGTKIEDVIRLYSFDQKLRLLVLSAIEPIEIALRTQIIYHLSHKYGVFGYLEPTNFSNRFNHEKWLNKLKKAISESTETFLLHYRKKYTLNSDPPLWMALEVISFGSLSHLFKGLKGFDQQEISKLYGLKDTVLLSWLHTLAYLRNICAHHARLWNRTLTFKPLLPLKSEIWKDIKNNRVYCLLSIIKYLLNKINTDSEWSKNLKLLVKEYSEIPLTAMGFPSNWINEKIWI